MKNKLTTIVGMCGAILFGVVGYVECYAVSEGLTFNITSNGTLTIGGGAINSSAAVSTQPNNSTVTLDNVFVTDNRSGAFKSWILTANATGWTINGMPINNNIPVLISSTTASSNGTVTGLTTPVDLMQYNATIANCTAKAGTVVVKPMVAIGAQGGSFASGVYAVNITYYLTPTP